MNIEKVAADRIEVGDEIFVSDEALRAGQAAIVDRVGREGVICCIGTKCSSLRERPSTLVARVLVIDLAKLYPDGRTFYYEGDDLPSFIKAVHGLGLWPATNYPPPESGLEPFTTVEVAAERLDEFYALNLRVGT